MEKAVQWARLSMSSKTRLAIIFLLSQRLAAESLGASGRSSWLAAKKLIPAARRNVQYFVSRIAREISEISRVRRNKKQGLGSSGASELQTFLWGPLP